MKLFGLALLRLVYQLVYYSWRLGYQLGFRKGYVAKVPVLSVGNLSVGGTGKTPVVDWLLGALRDRGIRVGLVTRGYGRVVEPEVLVLEGTASQGGPGRFGDEPWSLHQQHPECLIAVHNKRDLAAQSIEDQVDLLIMDDGFQHWRLQRDIDWVLLDPVAGVEMNRLLPVGRLREPPTALYRADAVLLTKCNLADPAPLEQWLDRELDLKVPVIQLNYEPCGVTLLCANHTEPLSVLEGKKIFAFCGIGNPEAFWKSLQGLGAEVMGQRALSDHQLYDQALINELSACADQVGAQWMVCTEKDGVKIESLGAPRTQIYSLAMKITGTEQLEFLLDESLSQSGIRARSR